VGVWKVEMVRAASFEVRESLEKKVLCRLYEEESHVMVGKESWLVSMAGFCF